MTSGKLSPSTSAGIGMPIGSEMLHFSGIVGDSAQIL